MKDERIQVRAETLEKATFLRAAKRKGMSLSDWLRVAGREAAAADLGECPEVLFGDG